MLSKEDRFRRAGAIARAYDEIYTKHSSVWEDQGRTPALFKYFSRLIQGLSPKRVLEIGCGEGFLLAELPAGNAVGIDLSPQAIRKAQSRVSGHLSVALAERLPFADRVFDVVASIGTMEHFLDDREALREIWRVLEPDGYCVSLIHVTLPLSGRLAQKVSEYLYPSFRPGDFVQWLGRKLHHPVCQPIQNAYTESSGRACLERSGFTVLETISKRTAPEAPLIGPHVVIYVARK